MKPLPASIMDEKQRDQVIRRKCLESGRKKAGFLAYDCRRLVFPCQTSDRGTLVQVCARMDKFCVLQALGASVYVEFRGCLF